MLMSNNCSNHFNLCKPCSLHSCTKTNLLYAFSLQSKLQHKLEISSITSSLPWDQSTVLGYCVDICFILAIGEVYLLVHGALLLLFISTCLYHRAFRAVFQQAIENRKSGDEEFLCDLIRFHISVEKLSFEYPIHLWKKTSNDYRLIPIYKTLSL